MKKVLVICGPTATGKTKLAIYLIKALSLDKRDLLGEIISVDSRQVYQKMDIGTGKDLPLGAKFTYPEDSLKKKKIGCYQISGVKIWGYDLVSPKEDFSVATYLRKTVPIIKNILSRDKMPVLVGGSGLYLKSLVDGILNVLVPRDNNLRRWLSDLSVSELFEKLAQLDSKKAASLNLSDRKNPRRLVRAIEVAQWRARNLGKKVSLVLPWDKDSDFLFIGLMAPLPVLKNRIKKRVIERLRVGFKKEVLELLRDGIDWSFHSMDTLGYKNIKNYLLGKMNKKEMIEDWVGDEFAYARRQMTWFKKDKRIIWFDISKGEWLKEVEKTVKNWYYS